MKKNTLLLLIAAIGIVAVYLFLGGGLKRDVANDADFYADEQLSAQAGCTASTTPTITALSATNITSSSATITWTTNIASTSEVKFWKAPQTANSVAWLPIADASGVTAHSYAISGLTASKTYSYRVRSAAVPSGCRKTSGTSTFVTLSNGGGSTAPATPTGFSAAVSSCTAATLSWIAPAGATGYEVYGPTSACNVNGSAGYCGSTAGTSLTLSNLTASKTYSGSSGQYAGFTVLAYNNIGYSAAAPRLTVTTPACGSTDTIAPTTTTAAPAGTWSNTNVSRTLTCTDNTGGSGCSATFWQFVSQGTTCPAVGTGYTTGTAASTSVDGQWRLCYYSKDVAGNTEAVGFQEIYKLDHTAPTGSISSPAAGQTVTGTSVSLAASASDALSGVASVAFKVDGSTVATDTTSPYSATWNSTTVADGSHSVSALITDAAGNTYTTPSISVTTSNIVVSLPSTPTGLNATSITQTSFMLNWSASSGATSYEVYGPSSAGSCPSGTCGTPTTTSLAITGLTCGTTYSGSTGANAGFTVLARNTAGYSAASARLTVTTSACTTNAAPVVTITSPTSAATYSTLVNAIGLGGTASDDVSVSSVTWRNQTTGVSGTATGTTSWTTPAIVLQSGANTLVVTATDGAGLTSTDTLTVTYTTTTNTAPTVTITSPTSATTYATSSNTVALGGTASDDVSVASVSYVNQTTGFSATATGTTSWSTANIPLQSGTNTLVVTATDGAGLTSTDTLTVTYSSLSATAWPASATGTEIGTGLTAAYEPSGAFWNPADQMLYFVSDTGKITQMDQTGATVTNWTALGNLEAITGTSTYNLATLNYLYVVDETTSTLKEFNPATGLYTNRTWSLSIVPTDIANNNGIEGIAFVPNGMHPYNALTTGGVFYVSSQSTGKIYVLSIDLTTSGSTPSLLATITPNLITTGGNPNDISDLYYSTATNKLFVLYDTNNVVHEMRPNGLFVNEYAVPSVSATGEEAISTIPTCNAANTSIVLGYDDGGATHHLYKFTNYPQPCVDATAPIISNLATPVTGTSANFTWDTNEYSDSKVEYGIGSYTYSVPNTTLKTTGHSLSVTGLTQGTTYQFRVTSKDQAGNPVTSTGNFLVPGSTGTDPYIVAAGDIAISGGGQMQTSDYILNNLAAASGVFALGDDAYDNGALTEFNSVYNPSWGRTGIINITHPVPGNHEYNTANASGYFSYFQGKGVNVGTTGQGWYSFNVGTWHIVALNTNSECSTVSCAAGSAQETWLRNDLAANPTQCSIALWHHPRFTSGTGHTSSTATQPLWKAFQDYGGDVILNGHVHNYERFAPQTSSTTGAGVLDNTNGIREFVVGTGGTYNFYTPGSPIVNSLKQIGSTYGILKLTLHTSTYDWQFIRTSDGSVLDAGTGSCH